MRILPISTMYSKARKDATFGARLNVDARAARYMHIVNKSMAREENSPELADKLDAFVSDNLERAAAAIADKAPKDAEVKLLLLPDRQLALVSSHSISTYNPRTKQKVRMSIQFPYSLDNIVRLSSNSQKLLESVN